MAVLDVSTPSSIRVPQTLCLENLISELKCVEVTFGSSWPTMNIHERGENRLSLKNTAYL